MEYSRYQLGIFDWIEHGFGNALVEACPGSGKTTTLIAAANRVPRAQTLAFLAFNRSTVQELRERFQRPAVIKTVHAMGFQALVRRIQGRVVVDGHKSDRLMEAHLHEDARAQYSGLIRRTVALAKAYHLMPDDDPAAWHDLLDRFDFVADDEAVPVVGHARHILRLSDQTLDLIDHEDMIRLPVLHNFPFARYDWVLLDEAQDISVAQRQLLHRLLKPSSRLLAVGDPAQSIYAFRGASHSSMDDLCQDFECTTLPLSISYRCPENVIAYARTIYPVIEPAPKARAGKVLSLLSWRPGQFGAGDMVLCRNVAPLVSMFYTLIHARVPARILGSDLTATLSRIVKRLDTNLLTGPDGLGQRLLAWRREQVAKCLRQGKLEKAATVEDHTQVLLTALAHSMAETLDGFLDELKAIFSRDGSVTLSTIHRAKGLEADCVYILDPNLMPSYYAQQDWQLQQERNLEYVAVTRARQQLIFIRSEDQRDDLDQKLVASAVA